MASAAASSGSFARMRRLPGVPQHGEAAGERGVEMRLRSPGEHRASLLARVCEQLAEDAVDLALEGGEVEHAARSAPAQKVGIPAHGTIAAANETVNERPPERLDEAEEMCQLLRVVVDPDAEARVDGGYVLGDLLGRRVLPAKARIGCRERTRQEPPAGGLRGDGADGSEGPARDGLTPDAAGDDPARPAHRPQNEHPVARAHVVDVAAEDPVDTRDRVGRAVRPGHVLRPFQHTAQQERAHRAAAPIGCDDGVRAADPADRAAVHAHPPRLDADEPDDLPALLRDERRQLFVGPRVIEHEPDERALVEVPALPVCAKEGDHRRHVARRERADHRRHAREPISA